MVLWKTEGTQLVKKEKSEDSIIIRCLKDSSKLRHLEKPSQAEVEVGYDSHDLEPVTVAVVEYNNLTVYLGTIREKTMTFAKAKLWKLNNQLCKKKMLDSSLQLAKNDVLEIDENYLISKFNVKMEKYYYPRSRNCQFLIPL